MHQFHAFLVEHFKENGRDVFWHSKGECLMSGVDTLDPARNNHTMILGLNPGGDRLPPLGEQVKEFFEKCSGPWSCYIDQCWHPSGTESATGCGPTDRCGMCSQPDGIKHKFHQKRVRALADSLRLDLHRTLTMNAIFNSSRNADGIRNLAGSSRSPVPPKDLFRDVFFSVVKRAITEARINHVICLGNGQGTSSFSLMANAYGLVSNDLWSRPSRDVRFFEADDLKVAGVPHPSWPTKLSDEGMQKLKEWYRSTSG